MSVRESFGNAVGDLQIEMSNSPAHYRRLTQLVKQALLDESEAIRTNAQGKLQRTSIIYDVKFGTSCTRPKNAPLLYAHRHREHITQSLVTANEIYLILADDEGQKRMAYLCGLEQALTEGMNIRPFKLKHDSVREDLHP
ncbi:hypothetical protein EXS73_03050 [Candidatus Pacearchaeota archaeon]|nr:hypothetical protein [Candidatus Pacearchaeota archaeon]